MRQITEEQYKFAQNRIEELLPVVDDNTPLDDPKAVELMMMSDIVIDYETEHFPIDKPTPAELIAYGLKEAKMTQKQLASEMVSAPHALTTSYQVSQSLHSAQQEKYVDF